MLFTYSSRDLTKKSLRIDLFGFFVIEKYFKNVLTNKNNNDII